MSNRVDTLRDWLAAMPALDDRLRAYRARMLQLLESGESALARSSYSPGHFTASAFVLSPDGRELLLIHHSKLNLWLQPGGHIEPTDEDALAGARREVLEETGLECDVVGAGRIFDIDIHSIPARGEAPEHEHFDVRFLLAAKGFEHCASSDAVSARWVPLNDVAGVQSDESVLRAVRKLATVP